MPVTRLRTTVAAMTAIWLIGAGGAYAADHDDDEDEDFRARLSGFQEVPVVFSDGRGRFRAERVGDQLKYRLTFNVNSPVRFVHIHLGRPGVNGGVMAFLCNNAGVPPSGINPPPCPLNNGTVTGTLSADDILAPAARPCWPT